MEFRPPKTINTEPQSPIPNQISNHLDSQYSHVGLRLVGHFHDSKILEFDVAFWELDFNKHSFMAALPHQTSAKSRCFEIQLLRQSPATMHRTTAKSRPRIPRILTETQYIGT